MQYSVLRDSLKFIVRTRMKEIVLESNGVLCLGSSDGKEPVMIEDHHLYIYRDEWPDFWFETEVIQTDDGDPITVKQIFTSEYYLGELHRIDGPAETRPDGYGYYYMGELHRKDGPAYKSKDGEEWCRFGTTHRNRGPAITHADGSEFWVINGRDVTKEVEEFCKDQPTSWQLWDADTWVQFGYCMDQSYTQYFRRVQQLLVALKQTSAHQAINTELLEHMFKRFSLVTGEHDCG